MQKKSKSTRKIRLALSLALVPFACLIMGGCGSVPLIEEAIELAEEAETLEHEHHYIERTIKAIEDVKADFTEPYPESGLKHPNEEFNPAQSPKTPSSDSPKSSSC